MKPIQEYEKDIASISTMMERSAPTAAGMLLKKHLDAMEAVVKQTLKFFYRSTL